LKFPSKLRLSKVLSKDGLRAILTGVLVKSEKVEVLDPDPSKGLKETMKVDHLVAYGTNSYCFVRVDLTAAGIADDGDVPGPIPAVALKHLERGVQAGLGEKEIVAGITRYDRVISDAVTTGGDQRYKPGEEVQYPNWHNLYPEFSENVVKIGLNAQFLADLAAAMGTGNNGVVLEIDMDKLRPVSGSKEKTVLSVMKVKTQGHLRDRAEGLLMPMRVNV
jgi:hypothetical protein